MKLTLKRNLKTLRIVCQITVGSLIYIAGITLWMKVFKMYFQKSMSLLDYTYMGTGEGKSIIYTNNCWVFNKVRRLVANQAGKSPIPIRKFQANFQFGSIFIFYSNYSIITNLAQKNCAVFARARFPRDLTSFHQSAATTIFTWFEIWLTHCGLVTLHGNRNLGQHWLR